mmetsp:Transcript_7552/g.13943  ORF Transcript_7552/g.13943 Transcript_7552/m.13943 type:complete len:137 (-) Transcript_7552:111-521(-)
MTWFSSAAIAESLGSLEGTLCSASEKTHPVSATLLAAPLGSCTLLIWTFPQVRLTERAGMSISFQRSTRWQMQCMLQGVTRRHVYACWQQRVQKPAGPSLQTCVHILTSNAGGSSSELANMGMNDPLTDGSSRMPF